MKAFLLAAGEGTRLRPLTLTVPKCLVPIQGKPLLYYWLRLCEMYGVEEVLINLHHFPEKVIEFVSQYQGPVKVRFAHEPVLLGSAGTVRENWAFVEKEESFFVFYSDNLTNINLAKLKQFHESHQGLITMALFRAPNPGECGIALLNADNLILQFEEKPAYPKSNLANAGIYLARQAIRDFLPAQGFSDLGYDVLPRLAGKIYGWVMDEYLIDIGTPENYELAQREWEGL